MDSKVIANCLKALRAKVNKTGQEIEKATGMHQTVVSRIERGKKVPTSGELLKMLKAYNVPDTAIEEMLALLPVVEQYDKAAPEKPVREFMNFLMRTATRYSCYSCKILPAAVQSTQYKTALLKSLRDGVFSFKFEDYSRYCLQWGTCANLIPGVLYITESCFTSPRFGSEVMVEQLKHILTLCDSKNLTIRIIPNEALVPMNSLYAIQTEHQSYKKILNRTYAWTPGIDCSEHLETCAGLSEQIFAHLKKVSFSDTKFWIEQKLILEEALL